MLLPFSPPRARGSRGRPSNSAAASASADEGIQVVLNLLRERMGMDVVFVRHFTEGARRFRVVEALHHGPAAALATGQGGSGQPGGTLLETPIVLPGGRVHGSLCCFCAGADPAQAERDLRWLRHGARLAARLLDNEQVLRELARQSLSH